MKIGIPRALFYYQYYPFWKTFFESLDQKIVLSSPTNKDLLKKGLELCVDDACLPVKIFHGHVANLIGKVDTIFIPRIISIEPKEYICPKFLGLPDMIKNSIPDLPDIIDVDLNLYKSKIMFFRHFIKLGEILNKNKKQILIAFNKAQRVQQRFEYQLIKEKIVPQDILSETYKISQNEIFSYNPSKLKVLLLGHHYNIYDDFISMNLIMKLRKKNVTFITSEMVTNKIIVEGTKNLSKDMFWTLGKKAIGTAYYYLERKKVDGIIHVASFGCGPDSLVGEILEKRTRRDFHIPFLFLNLDEHSGEAGFNTRLEAFLDVLEGRKYFEDNIPTYG
ncbi:MAG: acyl-CoA dehydratase activase-related protein [Tepidanaerobacteraceae bacterium]|nr:acyl-CoA dehydratase activase-related protein [Tepidanaerobacteraceae bacterium]